MRPTALLLLLVLPGCYSAPEEQQSSVEASPSPSASPICEAWVPLVEIWQKDAYKESGKTAGWPPHTTVACYVVNRCNGAREYVTQATNHGTALDANHGSTVLIKQFESLCGGEANTKASARALASQICGCTCDAQMTTQFLSLNQSPNLSDLRGFLGNVNQTQMNAALNCGGTPANPTQTIINKLDQVPPDYAGIVSVLSACAPNWTQAFSLLLGAAWNSYHVCNNDAAVEQYACSNAACPAVTISPDGGTPTPSPDVVAMCRPPKIL
jgi:hypothetical protein